MSRRHVNKRSSRERRELRRDLVHASGCTFRGCGRWAPCLDLILVQETLAEAIALGVRIPRSLRRLAKGRADG